MNGVATAAETFGSRTSGPIRCVKKRSWGQGDEREHGRKDGYGLRYGRSLTSPEMVVDDGDNRGKGELDSGRLGPLRGGFWGQSREEVEGYL